MRRERRLKKLLTSQETGSNDKHVAVSRILTTTSHEPDL